MPISANFLVGWHKLKFQLVAVSFIISQGRHTPALNTSPSSDNISISSSYNTTATVIPSSVLYEHNTSATSLNISDDLVDYYSTVDSDVTDDFNLTLDLHLTQTMVTTTVYISLMINMKTLFWIIQNWIFRA